ncbi:hypothetical protein [Paraburkholderia sp. 2C]
MMKTLVRAHLSRHQLLCGSEPAIALRCSRRRKEVEPGSVFPERSGDNPKLNSSGNPGGDPLRSFYPIRTSLASAPAQRLF